MQLPSISSYVQPAKVNAMRVDLPEVTVWFSYRTPVAFQARGFERVVRENDWGPTTGKHLNAIDGGNKKSRVNAQEFQRLWSQQITEMPMPV